MGSLLNAFMQFFRPLPAAPRIGDQDKVDRLYRFWRWSIFLSITLGYGLFYTTRLSFSVAKKPLIDAGVMTVQETGTLGFVLLIAYAAGKFFNGLIADRVNPARFFAVGLALSAATNIVFGLSSSYAVFLMLWAINGWVQSSGAPTSGVTMAAWFSNRERGTRYAVWSTSHNIGEAITFAFTSIVVAAAGWRWGFLGPGIICAAASLLLYHTLSDRPRTRGLPPIASYNDDPDLLPADDHLSLKQLQLEVLKNYRVWLLAFSSALMYVPRYAINHWAPLYLQVERGYTQVEAGFVAALFPFVGLAGSASSGIISDRFFGARRSPVTLVYGVLFVASLSTLFLMPSGHPWLVRLAMGGAGFAIGGLLVFLGGLTAMDICSKRASGAALGLVGGVSYVGAALQDLVSGILIEGSARVVDGTTIYSFSTVKYVWIGSAVLSMLLPLTIWSAEQPPPRPASATPPR